MKIYDISQEVYGCAVFPGDPEPQKEILTRIADGGVCNLTRLTMCVHNGTHVDAPYHFFDDGKTVDELPPEIFVGYCVVAEADGELKADKAAAILREAARTSGECARDYAKRVLIKGKAVVTAEAAEVFAENGVLLLGNESQTVGPEDSPAAVHRILLGAGTVLLEGIRLEKVPAGTYLLSAAPLNLGGSDGAPCRAVLIEL